MRSVVLIAAACLFPLTPLPAGAGESRIAIDRALFLRITDEMIESVERGFHQLDFSACQRDALGWRAMTGFKLASSRMSRYFPVETLKTSDPAAYELVGAIRSAGAIVETLCLSASTTSVDETKISLEKYKASILRAASLFHRYYREAK